MVVSALERLLVGFLVLYLHRLTCLSICLDLVKRCCLLYKELVSFAVILQPIKTLLSNHLTAQMLPDTLQVGATGGTSRRSFRFYLRLLLSPTGAAQGDPGGHRQRSHHAPPAGFREEETHPSEAAHPKDCGSVSRSFSEGQQVKYRCCCCRHRFKDLHLRLDYGKKRGCTREEKEKERLKHKYKKEFKGALRELRKDSRFLAREKLNEVIQRCHKPP